jgi:hypothetical protein
MHMRKTWSQESRGEKCPTKERKVSEKKLVGGRSSIQEKKKMINFEFLS